MRNALALATLACLMISGCSSSDDGGNGSGAPTDTATTGGGGMGSTTGATTGAPVGNATHYACTTTAGAAVLQGNGIGGCVLINGIPSIGTVTVMTPASGCSVEFDEGSDGQYDGAAAVGDEYKEGTAFAVFCDPTMAPNSESSIDVQLTA